MSLYFKDSLALSSSCIDCTNSLKSMNEMTRHTAVGGRTASPRPNRCILDSASAGWNEVFTKHTIQPSASNAKSCCSPIELMMQTLQMPSVPRDSFELKTSWHSIEAKTCLTTSLGVEAMLSKLCLIREMTPWRHSTWSNLLCWCLHFKQTTALKPADSQKGSSEASRKLTDWRQSEQPNDKNEPNGRNATVNRESLVSPFVQCCLVGLKPIHGLSKTVNQMYRLKQMPCMTQG